MKANARLLAILSRHQSLVERGEFPPVAACHHRPDPARESPVSIGAAAAAEYLHSLWILEKLKEGGGQLGSLDIDDWCPTGSDVFRLPPWWQPMANANPDPDWRIAFHAGFAGHIAAIAPQLKGSSLEKPAIAALDRSLGVLEQGAL
jgi:hypothetical protein